MDLFEAIRKRHSYRGEFVDSVVTREKLCQIVEAGIMAPSGKNCQTTEFVIIDDPKILKAIQDMASIPAMRQAKAIILAIIPKKYEPVYEGHSFVLEDCAAAVENMLLAITALGYASVWIDGWLRVDGRAEKIGELVGLSTDKVVRVMLPIGVAKERVNQKEKKTFNERCCFNLYNGK